MDNHTSPDFHKVVKTGVVFSLKNNLKSKGGSCSMMPYEWTLLLENVALPGVVTMYLLIRHEQKMDRLARKIDALKKGK
jgi:type IV secretory pathway VirB4 component